MGTKRVGLARTESLIEALNKRNVVVRSATTAHDLTGLSADTTVIYTGTMDGNVTLPQATAVNVGMVIKIIYSASSSNTARKLGFTDAGSTVITGNFSIGALDAGPADENISFAITSNAKVFAIDANDLTGGGGAAGSMYTFTYFGANTVFCEARAMTTGGTPAPDAASTSATGI